MRSVPPEPRPGAAAPDLLDTPQAGGVAIRGSGLRAGGFALITLLGLVSAPVLTRHLGVVDFGRFMAVVSLIALVGTVTEGGLNALGVRELAVLPPERREALMRNLLGIRLVLTVAGVALAVAFAAAAGYGAELVAGTALAGLGLLTYVGQGTLGLPLAARLRLGAVTAGEVLRQVIYVVAVVALVLAGAGLVPLLAAPIAGGLAGMALMLRLAGREAPWRPSFDFDAWRRIARETLPIAAAGAINSVYFRLVILLMSVVAAGVQTGYFALSFRIIEVLIAVPYLLIAGMLPLFARAARDDQERLAFAFTRTFDVALIAGIGLAVVTALGAPLAIGVLTGSATGPAIDVLRIQALTLIPIFISTAYGSVFIALRRHRDLIAVNLGALAVLVVAAAVLIPLGEAKGAAVATVIGDFTLLAAYVIGLRRARPDLHPSLRRLAPALAAAAVAVGLAVLIDVPRVPNLADAVIAAVAYVAALAAFRGIPPELTGALWRRT